ncbi:MAG TPA: UDP-glucose 4-epimerase GalE [Spirochaetia bacterium]|jgi:UDP-glucose 4-epimerase|nr:UDP-glucose 4-epimerase GalE [Spirochaetia bacterium]
MTILVTGGAGYIGSHTTLELLKAGHEVIVVDNLSNAKPESLKRVSELAGRAPVFHQVDILDRPALDKVFAAHRVDAVIHFAAFKAVGESVAEPLKYYKNNITGTIVLCEAMKAAGVKNLVFSSSATVYGENPNPPFDESQPTSATNPYGWTKVMMEQIFRDICVAQKDWNVVLLRYFNPVGAHESGRIGEDPTGVPANLLPFVSQVAVGMRPQVKVFGNDYPTPDGTGLRDYIHVVDLAIGHLKAVEKLTAKPGLVVYNLGTGNPSSVLDVIRAFEKASGKKVPFEIVARRPGDVAASYANPAKAQAELGWKAVRGLDQMCADAWKWQSANPKGFL